MIRINLLAVERERTAKRAGGLTVGQRLTIACSIILVVTAIGIVWWFWHLQQRDAQLDRDIQAAEQETVRLREVLAQVQKFEGQRAQLQQRVALIEDLRRGQSGSVHMLDQISRALPDRLWLTQMRDEPKDDTTTIEGYTTSMTALSDLVGNLESSGYFKRPVEIINSNVESQQGTELVRFSVKLTFVMPGSEAPAPAVPGAPGAAVPRAAPKPAPPG
jgi:type IV pilus assembly protein PilN